MACAAWHKSFLLRRGKGVLEEQLPPKVRTTQRVLLEGRSIGDPENSTEEKEYLSYEVIFTKSFFYSTCFADVLILA